MPVGPNGWVTNTLPVPEYQKLGDRSPLVPAVAAPMIIRVR